MIMNKDFIYTTRILKPTLLHFQQNSYLQTS